MFSVLWEIRRLWIFGMELEFIQEKSPPRRQVSWVELFSLSAVGHGLIVGTALVVWLGLNPDPSNGVTQKGKGVGEAVCFWDDRSSEPRLEPFPPKPFRPATATSSDLVPFTIQMSPIGLADRFAPLAGAIPSGMVGQGNSFGMNEKGPRGWFDSSQLPEKTAWLIDCSLSMGIHSHFARAHQQLQVSLGQLSPHSKARVWAFAKFPREIAATGEWSNWTPARGQIAGLDLENTVPAGNTDLASALRVVLATNPDLIQVVTDEDQLSEKDLASLRRLQSRQAKPMPRMRVIVMTRPAVETPLQVFCRQAGCSYQVIPALVDSR